MYWLKLYDFFRLLKSLDYVSQVFLSPQTIDWIVFKSLSNVNISNLLQMSYKSFSNVSLIFLFERKSFSLPLPSHRWTSPQVPASPFLYFWVVQVYPARKHKVSSFSNLLLWHILTDPKIWQDLSRSCQIFIYSNRSW